MLPILEAIPDFSYELSISTSCHSNSHYHWRYRYSPTCNIQSLQVFIKAYMVMVSLLN